MHPTTATCVLAPPSRPPAVPLIEPAVFTRGAQPTLPWTVAPEVVINDAPIDPGLHQLAASLTSALIEVVSGQRSSVQLERWVEPELLNLLDHLRRARRSKDLRLHSMRVQAPHAEALEVSAHLRQHDGSRAAALRITRRRGQWVVTHLSIALRPDVIHRAGWISPLVD